MRAARAATPLRGPLAVPRVTPTAEVDNPWRHTTSLVVFLALCAAVVSLLCAADDACWVVLLHAPTERQASSTRKTATDTGVPTSASADDAAIDAAVAAAFLDVLVDLAVRVKAAAINDDAARLGSRVVAEALIAAAFAHDNAPTMQ